MVEISTLNMVVGIITWLAGQLVVGAAIWGAIRSDLKHMFFTQTRHQEEIKESREKIDKLFQMYYTAQRNNST